MWLLIDFLPLSSNAGRMIHLLWLTDMNSNDTPKITQANVISPAVVISETFKLTKTFHGNNIGRCTRLWRGCAFDNALVFRE